MRLPEIPWKVVLVKDLFHNHEFPLGICTAQKSIIKNSSYGDFKNIAAFLEIIVSLVKIKIVVNGWEHICWIYRYEWKLCKTNSLLSQDQTRESTHMIFCDRKTSYHSHTPYPPVL